MRLRIALTIDLVRRCDEEQPADRESSLDSLVDRSGQPYPDPDRPIGFRPEERR